MAYGQRLVFILANPGPLGPWNWGQAWCLRSDFVDATRGHAVPDVEEHQMLRAGDINGVGVTDL